MKIRLAVALALLAGAIAIWAASPASAAYNNPPVIVCSPAQVGQGGSVTITGSGFDPNSTVTINSGAQVLGTVETDSTGAFTFTFTTESFSVGEHEVSAAQGANVASLTFEVLAAGAASGGGSVSSANGSGLPRTGSSWTGPLLEVGAVLVVAGGLFVLIARRRSANRPSHAR